MLIYITSILLSFFSCFLLKQNFFRACFWLLFSLFLHAIWLSHSQLWAIFQVLYQIFGRHKLGSSTIGQIGKTAFITLYRDISGISSPGDQNHPVDQIHPTQNKNEHLHLYFDDNIVL